MFISCADDKAITSVNTDGLNDANIEFRISSDCIPEDSISGCNGPFFYTDTVNVPDYPTCDFYIQTDYYLCGNPQIGFSVIFGEVHIVAPFNFANSDCQDFITDYQNAITAGQTSLEAFFNNFYDEVYKGVSVNWIMEQIDQIGTTALECPDPSFNMSTSFYGASCYKICILPEHDPPVWTRVNCGEGCCMRTYEWCWDEENQELDVTITTRQIVSGGCVDPGLSYCDSKEQDCLFTCD